MECRFCKTTENLIKDSHKINKLGETIQSYRCRDCNRRICAKFRETEAGRISTRKAVYKYMEKNKERALAWKRAQYWNAIEYPCIICGNTPAERHHPNIREPRIIVWLCRVHHKQADRNVVK